MQNDTITCPVCQSEFPLTETLAQPLIAAERERAVRELQERTSALQNRESGLARDRNSLAQIEKEIEKRAATIEATVQQKLESERKALAEAAEATAAGAYENKVRDLEQELTRKRTELANVERMELQVRREREELEEDKRRLELDVERRLDSERSRIREATQQEEEESHRLKMAEKEKVIESMRKQVEELRRKSEQGSQQIQGEVLEDEVEVLLSDTFPSDHFDPIPNGRAGGDLVQTVVTNGGLICGTILWESKNTKNWSQDWLAKNRQDQRGVSAHVGVIVTSTLPKGLETFAYLDGVWVTSKRCALPLAFALRQTLLETARVHAAARGGQTKKDLLYSYLTSEPFRQRIAAIVESHMSLHKDLQSEKLALSRLWAKREKQINMLMAQTAGMYGDVQGIVGKSMPEVEGLTIPLLEDGLAMDEQPEDHGAPGSPN